MKKFCSVLLMSMVAVILYAGTVEAQDIYPEDQFTIMQSTGGYSVSNGFGELGTSASMTEAIQLVDANKTGQCLIQFGQGTVLDIGSEQILLTDGSYTIQGKLKGGNGESLLKVCNAAKAIISAEIENTAAGSAIIQESTGEIDIFNSTIKSYNSSAILSKGLGMVSVRRKNTTVRNKSATHATIVIQGLSDAADMRLMLDSGALVENQAAGYALKNESNGRVLSQSAIVVSAGSVVSNAGGSIDFEGGEVTSTSSNKDDSVIVNTGEGILSIRATVRNEGSGPAVMNMSKQGMFLSEPAQIISKSALATIILGEQAGVSTSFAVAGSGVIVENNGSGYAVLNRSPAALDLNNVTLKASDNYVLYVQHPSAVTYFSGVQANLSTAHTTAIYTKGIVHSKTNINSAGKIMIEYGGQLSTKPIIVKNSTDDERWGIANDGYILAKNGGDLIAVTDPAPRFLTTALPDVKKGTTYRQQIAFAGEKPLTLALCGGSLPDGVKLDKDALSGTPVKGGQYEFVLELKNDYGTARQTFYLTVAAAEDRLCGDNRFETAVEISRYSFSGGAESVLLVDGFNFPDALAASPLAYALNAPVLMVDTVKQEIDAKTMAEIKRLEAKNIYILGGSSVIGGRIESALHAQRYQVRRIAGNNRYGTAAEIAKRLDGIAPYDKVVIANGLNYPDALSVGSAAARYGYPILFVSKDKIPEETLAVLSGGGIQEIIIVGGSSVVGGDVEAKLRTYAPVRRLAGDDRIQTAVKIQAYFYAKTDVVYVSTAYNFADALAGGVAAAREQAAMILVDGKAGSVPAAIRAYVQNSGAKRIVVLGGQSVIGEQVKKMLVDCLKR